MGKKVGSKPDILYHGTATHIFNPDLTFNSDGIYLNKELFLKGEELPFKSKHFIQNTMAAIGACVSLNVDHNAIKTGISSYKPLSRRFSVLKSNPLIIDDFAHNPDGITATIKSTAKMSEGTLHIVFAIRGSRGELINQLNAEAVVNAIKNVNNSLLITSSAEVVDHLNTVNDSERKVVIDIFKEQNIEYIFKNELFDALNYTIQKARTTDTILLIGAQGMDPANEILSRIFRSEQDL